MVRFATALLLVMLGLFAVQAQAQGPDTPATPAEEYAAIFKAFHAEAYTFRQATSDAERAPVVDRANRLTLKLLALAERHPHDPAALDALVQAINQELWLQNNTTHPGFGQDSPEVKAIGVVLRDHLGSDKLAEATRRVQYGFRPECEKLLRAVIEKNPHRELRGLAALRLAQFLNLRLNRVDILRLRPEMA